MVITEKLIEKILDIFDEIEDDHPYHKNIPEDLILEVRKKLGDILEQEEKPDGSR